MIRRKIDTNLIPITPYDTEFYKIQSAYKKGGDYAMNHYFGESFDRRVNPDLMTWLDNPYSENRPSLQFAFEAGFYEKWAYLIRNDC